MAGPFAAPVPVARDVRARRPKRLRRPLLALGGLALATLALWWRDPHDAYSWGFCPSALLGFACPGCGGLRAVNDLTHGDLVAAASSNLALVVAAPFAVLGLALWLLDSWAGRPRRRLPAPLSWAVPAGCALLLLAFTVVRNLPGGSWLAP